MLLSGDTKYLLERADFDHVQQIGKDLYLLLSDRKDSEYFDRLSALHAFVKEKGTLIEAYKNANIIIPPIKSEPNTMRNILGIQKIP